ncbi:MAG TPA: type IV pilus secretin PilQ [Thermoanaerobaculia bacterium]|nr:type IV pilus secretin PilQ [Thermoanaerobaculia bacterium]
MGDVVIGRQSAGWQRLTAALAVLAVAAGGGCTSSKPARVVEATPVATAAPAEAKAAPADAKAAPAPTQIRTIDLREGAPEVFVDLESSAPLVWTSFRNSDGKVVVELPNTVPEAGIANLAPADGLVSTLEVTRVSEGTRPLTRLVIATRQEVEHSVTADGTKLQIQLMPVGQQARAGSELDFEPLDNREEEEDAAGSQTVEPAAEPVQTAEPVAAAAPRDAGTPDRPAVAPAPSGVAATRLDAIEVLSSGGGAVIRIAGDGEFPYSTFALDQPERFVIDLEGVINRASRPTVSVDGSVVERVRVAQFKPYPQPVSRVVFDLRGESVPVIERTADALVVSFPETSGAAAPAVKPAAQAPVTPASDISQAPVRSTPEPAGAAVEIEEEDAPELPEPTEQEIRVTPSSSPAPASAQPSDLALAQPSQQPAPPQSRPQAQASSVAPGLPVQSFEAQAVGETERVYVGEPIDLKVTNADVTDVLRSFAAISGLNVVVQPGVSGVVTAELEGVPWDQALEQILKINNLDYELDGNVMRIAPTEVLRKEAQEKQQLAAAKALSVPLRTVYQRLSYADATQVARILKQGQSSLLSQRGSVVVDRRTNALIIKELPQYMDSVISVVDLLDSPEPQVMIEARIIETTKRFSREIGIAWGFDGIASAATGNTTGLVFPNNGDVAGDVNLGGNATAGVLSLRLGNVLNTFQLDATLRAAESEGLITILSAPKVATLNNERASIQSGLQIPVQTIFNDTITVQFINATLRLEVTPQVTAEGTILMDIDISKREPQFAFLVQGSPNAPIATKDARTRLVVRDGGTAVIGGIYKVTADAGETRIPGIANIPLIGHLFKNRNRREENEELLIFITPRIIKL